eukprot:TRINITY_DN3262_c0_g1_i2.p1 TRINITY_DN3262_c0_g1~~TRINITY_DN3262_c0_g1_i2.p1  ORF type:complete len:415 (+),score=96.43 TRINITY_DN3262_c0_g1_i2:60-1247(+)
MSRLSTSLFLLPLVFVCGSVLAQSWTIFKSYTGSNNAACDSPNNIIAVQSMQALQCYPGSNSNSFYTNITDPASGSFFLSYFNAAGCPSANYRPSSSALYTSACTYDPIFQSSNGAYRSSSIADGPFTMAPYPDAEYFVATIGSATQDTCNGPRLLYVFDKCVNIPSLGVNGRFRCGLLDGSIKLQTYQGGDYQCNLRVVSNITLSASQCETSTRLTVQDFGSCANGPTTSRSFASSTSFSVLTSTTQQSASTSALNSATTADVASTTSNNLVSTTNANSATTSQNSATTSSNFAATSVAATTTQAAYSTSQTLFATTSSVAQTTSLNAIATTGAAFAQSLLGGLSTSARALLATTAAAAGGGSGASSAASLLPSSLGALFVVSSMMMMLVQLLL